MAFAEDLLEQAYHLARREKRKPRQASLRRAVSTAYYALFHLLIREAVANWKRDDQRAELARTFEHSRMRKASNRIVGLNPSTRHPPAMVGLRRVASAFVQLQEFRELADYESRYKWSRTEALKAVDRTSAAFDAWTVIRKDKIAQDYLFRLLIPSR
jgi:hypothetical protein